MSVLRAALVALCLIVQSTGQAGAQIGPFMDWLHKMSGPRLRLYGASLRFPTHENYGQRFEAEDRRLLVEALESLQRIRAMDTTRAWSDSIAIANACLRNALDTVSGDWTRTPVFAEEDVDSLRLSLLRTAGNLVLYQRPGDPTATFTPSNVCSLTMSIGRLPQHPRHGVRGRLGLFYGDDRHNDSREDVYLRALAVSLSTEYFFGIPRLADRRLNLGLEAGITGLRYFIDPDEPTIDPTDFWGAALFGNLNYYPFAECSTWLLRNFRVGTGLSYFFNDPDRFERLHYTDVRKNEWVFSFFVGLDITFSSLRSAPRLGCGP